MFLVVSFLDAGDVGRSGNAALSDYLGGIRILNMSLPLEGFEDSFPLKAFWISFSCDAVKASVAEMVLKTSLPGDPCVSEQFFFFVLIFLNN